MDVINFDRALAETGSSGRHILLGNGFSIACKPDIFRYAALFENADFASMSPFLESSFAALGTRNFEEVIDALRKASRLASVYSSDTSLTDRMMADSESLRDILASTIAKSHPEMPSEIQDEQYAATKRFLANFKSIYTLNYDLLLYWTIMHEVEGLEFRADDGFRTPDEGETDYVTWEVENTDNQNIHYLHGALHIFDAHPTVQKYTWNHTGVRLITQVRQAMDRGLYPIIVSEGTSDQKIEVINHSNYLSRSYRSFARIGNSLFVFGHSLADNDDHILHLIPKGKIKALYIGLFGDPEGEDNLRMRRKAERLAISRKGKVPLALRYFDAGTVSIW